MKQDLFENAPVPKAYLTLALPVVMSMIVTLAYNMIDTYFIALTGNTNLVAGVSLMSPLFTLMIAFGDIWGLGGSSFISRLLGQRDYDKAKQVSAFAFWAAILFGLCVTAVLLIFRSQILSLLGAGESTLPYATAYYNWIAIGAAAIILGLVPSNILRTEGLATPAMVGSILGSVVNIILDPVCIFALHMGAAGAAVATVIGNIVADCFYVYVILRKSKLLSVNPMLAGFSIPVLSSVLSIGIPSSVTNIMQSLMVTITNHFLLAYGTDKVAALGIALKVNMISTLILVGFAFGGQPLVGYCYGARNRRRLGEVVRFAYMLEVGLAFVFTLIMIPSAPGIIRIFMQNSEIVTNGALMLRCLQCSLVFVSVALVSTCICQSFGKASGAFILSFSRQGILYAFIIFILSNVFGFMGILLSQACSDLITAVIALILIRKYMAEDSAR